MSATTGQALAHLARLRARKPKPAREPSANGFAYFCGPEDGPIKIGFSADPGERLYRLQTSHPEHLILWAEAEGGEHQERVYHRQFADHRLHGEWFSRHPDILAEIERINAEVRA